MSQASAPPLVSDDLAEKASVATLCLFLVALGFIIGLIAGRIQAGNEFIHDLCDGAKGYVNAACESEGW